MFIDTVIIRNFRSIESATIKFTNLNVIVGLNDIGKSNLLKAMNFFFNDETDVGKRLSFEEDYCFLTPPKQKKAREISIELHIQPPLNYTGSELIKWRKTWRKEGFYGEEIVFLSGNPFPRRSKFSSWLKNLKFKYVPAIKSDVYFQNLLGDLHDTLSATISDTLKNAGIDFIGKIKDNTKEITININKRLGFKSDIQLPSNLKELFKTLDFKTVHGAFEVSLQKRGDGIKTRHIPVILYFLSEQENAIRSHGSPKVNTIWGYEEPENNLELLKAYEVAQEFKEYSNNIQILLTSHSPAFYSLAGNSERVKAYLAKSDNQKTNYEEISNDNMNFIDEHMGVLQVITPYINEEVIKRKKLQIKIDDLQGEIGRLHLPTVFVEGKTDKIILEKYFSIKPLKKSIKIESSQDEGGAVYVHDMIVAWAYSKNQFAGIGLFDKDEAGIRYKKKAIDIQKVQDAIAKKRVTALQLEMPSHFKSIYQKGILLPISIEEIFPVQIWKIAESKGWLEERDNVRALTQLEIPNDKSLKQTLADKGFTNDEFLYIFYKIKDESKDKFARYIASLNSDLENIFVGFQKLHERVNNLV